jgi:mono/diheme cytochrome c family protein
MSPKAPLAAVVLAAWLASASPQSAGQAADALPEGEGKTILLAACATCHELREVTKFRGHFGPDEWRDIVRTMVEYGARVTDAEAEVLVDYLATHLGPQRR